MKKYKQIKEQEYTSWLNAHLPDESVMSMIGKLRDENFGNADQRKSFAQIITQLTLSNDPEARRFVRELGKWCTSYLMKHEKEV